LAFRPRARKGQNSPEVVHFSTKKGVLVHTSGPKRLKLARGPQSPIAPAARQQSDNPSAVRQQSDNPSAVRQSVSPPRSILRSAEEQCVSGDGLAGVRAGAGGDEAGDP